jgi:LPS-assembly protein
VETGQDSDLVAEVAGVIGAHWQARTSWQWDTGEGETDKLTVVARYQPQPGNLVNLAYRYLRDPTSEQNDLDQTDLSFRWQMSPRLSLVGRWNYDLPDSQLVDTFAGIEYETCCWGVRAVARRFVRGSDEEYSTGVFLQLVLKGLGGFGTETVSFLEKQIPGYENYF